MFTAQDARASLRDIEWEVGKLVPIVEGPYRYRIVVLCSPSGGHRAMFNNGEHPYFCYVELLIGGQWNKGGVSMVPVLPDGRLIMVVEQRPPQGRYYTTAMIVELDGGSINLDNYGPYSSLEFPGGGIDPGEGLRAGFLRELQEETGINEQIGLCYRRRLPIYHFGADVALQLFTGVVYLSGLSYKARVETDNGLMVLALSHDEVERNIRNGVICSGQAALLQWGFYNEVEAIRRDKDLENKLVQSGYLGVERIKIVNSN